MKADRLRWRIPIAEGVVAFQLLAAIFFLADSWSERDAGGFALVEIAVALALFAGAVFGAYALRTLLEQARRQEEALTIARGALGELIERKFAAWRLSGAEAAIALLALKGFTVAEIAGMRGSAEGTVRSQLSQVYAKAGVSSQVMLMSLFLDDLLDDEQAALLQE